MHFVKMHGLGNDFVVVEERADLEPGLVAAICDRHRGVGADGVLSVGSRGGVVVMGYWNADGSRAEMCGNGLRCVARYAFDRGLVEASEFEVVTPVGPRRARIEGDALTVELGRVLVGDQVRIDGIDLIPVSVGNPHAVTFVDDPADAPVERLAPLIASDPMFPEGTNVEFVAIGDDEITLRVWERGVGETLACGSGMAAAAAVARRSTHTDRITVNVPGGTGTVAFEGDVAWLTGPAVYVFEGDWPA